jgi:hypothetical protein
MDDVMMDAHGCVRDARAWTTGDVVVVGVAHDAAFPRTARGTWRHTAHRTE